MPSKCITEEQKISEFERESNKIIKNISYKSCFTMNKDKSVLLNNKTKKFISHKEKCEKYLIRYAFNNKDLLPKEVLWRTKEAFSDGVSSNKKSWFEVIQEFASNKLNISDGKFAENQYYYNIFKEYYGDKDCSQYIIPYKWMPKFINANDASARTLPIYNK